MPNEYKEVENTLSSALSPEKELRPEASAAMDERVNNTIQTLKTMQNENEVQEKLSFFSKVRLGLFATRKRKFATFSLSLLLLIPLMLVTLLVLTNGNSPIFRRQETLQSASADFAASKVTGDGVSQDSEFTLRTEIDYTQDELKENLKISPAVDFEVEKTKDGYKINPNASLQRNLLYEVELTGKDTNLNWNFRVEPGFSVLSHSPSESAAPINSTIEFNFNYSDLDLDSISAAFKSIPIIKIKEIKQEGRTVILIPEGPLSMNDSYSIYLDNTAKRQNGETLSVPYQAYLSTYNSEQVKNYPPSIYFSESGDEKLLRSDRKIVFSMSNYESNVKGNAKMYKVKNDTFIKAVKEYFSINSSYSSYRLDSKYLEEIKSEDFVPSQDVVLVAPEVAKGEMIYIEVSYMGIVKGDYYLSTGILSHMTYMQNEVVLNVFDSQGKIVNEGSAEVIYRDNNNQVQSKTFPINGVTRIPKSEIPNQDSILGAVVTSSGDRLILSMTSNFIPGSYYGYWGNYEGDSAYDKNIFSYFMMDKPVYTEGDKVRFKTQFRYSEDFTNFKVYDVSGLEYVFSYGGSIVSKTKPEYNKQYGYITGEFNVPAGGNSPLSGTIQVVKGNKVIATKNFPIREYVKPQYTVSISAEDSNKIYHPGDEVKFRVTVNDLAGNPWSGGEIEANFGYNENYRFSWLEQHSFVTSHYLSESFYGKDIVKLDSGGHATLAYRIDKPALSESSDLFSSVLEVNIGKHSTKSYGVMSSLGEVTVMAEVVDNNKSKKPGEEINIRTKTVDVQTLVGVSSTIEKLEVIRHWSERIPRTFYNSYTRTNETTYDYIPHEDIVDTQYNLKTNENGELVLVKKYELEGSYYFRFILKDSSNRPVLFNTSLFYLSGDNDDSNYMQDTTPIIVTDKNVYKIGEKVNIKVELPDKFLDGREAYLFVYKDKIYHEEKIAGNEKVYNSYVLTKELSPQAGIRLVFTNPVSEYGSEFVNEKYKIVDSVESSIDVRRDEDLLKVEITSEKKEYFPGEEVKMKLKVTDENGRTVSGANLNTRVFDKSLLTVLDQDSYQKDIYNKVFGVYGRIGSLFTFPKAPYWGDGGDGGQGPDGIRRNFDDVATFQSNLITDVSGNAELNFIIPDSITTWIVDVDAFTKKLNVGSSFIEITTNKDVIVNATFPESVRIGDKITPKVVVYNHTDSPISGKLIITASEGLALNNSEQSIKIEPRTGGTFAFDIEAKQSKSSLNLLTIKLIGEDGKVIDGIEKPIDVRLPGFPVSYQDSTKLNSGANEIRFNINGDLERASANLLISPSAYSHAFYIKDFSLNSSGERASSIIHNLALYKNYQKGQGVISMSENSLLDQISLSISALVDMENEDGGYGIFTWERF